MAKEKNNFFHNMLKEILEQPEIIKSIIDEHIDFNKNIVRFIDFKGKIRDLENIKRFILIGCGTSYHAGLIGNYIIEKLLGFNCEVEFADEFKLRDAVIEKHTAVIALSQSGETKDVVDAVSLARKKGVFTICITNGVDSILSRISDLSVYVCAGEEKALAATKTYTSELLILLLITLYFSRMHKLSLVKTKEIIRKVKILPSEIKEELKLENKIKIIARKYQKYENYAVLGRKYNFPTALEGALKLKETTYVHSEGFATGEFKHGPMAIIQKNFVSIFFAPNDSVLERNISIMKEIKNVGGKIIAISTKDVGKKLERITDDIIFIPKTHELLTPILSIIPIQLLAYHIAVLKGIDVDRPRNLSKFVV